MEKFWYKNYDKGVNPEINFSELPMTFPDVLRKAVSEYGDKIAVKSDNTQITYKEFDRLTSKIAGNLRLFGIDKQEKVCIFLPNCFETVLSFWSVERAGICGVMTNPLYSESELIHQITDSDAKAVITSDTLLAKIKAILPSVSFLGKAIILSSNAILIIPFGLSAVS